MLLKKSKKFNYKIFSVFIIAFLIPLVIEFIPNALASEVTFQNISAATAYKMIDKNNSSKPIIFDVRTQYEYSVTHLYNAILVPNDQLNSSLTNLTQYKDRYIIVYCKSGSRSELASEFLANNGFSHIYNMIGGISAWVESGFPVWSRIHNVTLEKNGPIDITPIIPSPKSSCGCGFSSTNTTTTPINFESTILKETDTYKETDYRLTINGTTSVFVENQSLLFSYNQSTKTTNRTLAFYFYQDNFTSSINEYYLLSYTVWDNNYTLEIGSKLTPCSSGFYISSETGIAFSSYSGEKTRTLEYINIDYPTTLSKQFNLLGNAAQSLAVYYNQSSDTTLKVFFHNYLIISIEANKLSELVNKYLFSYNYEIQSSISYLYDMYCNECTGTGGGGGDPCQSCLEMVEIFEGGAPESECYIEGFDPYGCGLAYALYLAEKGVQDLTGFNLAEFICTSLGSCA